MTAAFARVLTDSAALADTARLDLATQTVDAMDLSDSAALVITDVTAPIYGHLVATVHDPLTAAEHGSTLTATTEPTSRLEATNGV
jgi:hypothetical protein